MCEVNRQRRIRWSVSLPSLNVLFVSTAVYAELRHHFLPHAAATFLVFNCPQLSRSLTDTDSL